MLRHFRVKREGLRRPCSDRADDDVKARQIGFAKLKNVLVHELDGAVFILFVSREARYVVALL